MAMFNPNGRKASPVATPFRSQHLLQSDLVSSNLWCSLNYMELNIKKCSHTRVTRSTKPLPSSYSINSEQIPHVVSFKLLGVHISAELKWNLQTEYVRNRAMRALGMISRSFGGRGRSALRLLYLTLVRSLLVYGTPAWHPTTKCNLAKMEQVQSKAQIFILK